MGGIFVPQVQAQSNALKGFVMNIQMVPAICALDKQENKKRKCVEGYSLNISGLYPETTKKRCSTHGSATLLPLQEKVISRVMPDQYSRAQLWASYGGCVPMNASQYFRTIINYADRLNVPRELSATNDNNANIGTLRADFLKLNKSMPNQSLQFHCQLLNRTYVLTNINICYNTVGEYQQCPKQVVTNCPSRFTIKGAF